MTRKYTISDKGREAKRLFLMKITKTERNKAVYEDFKSGVSVPELQFKYKNGDRPLTSTRIYDIIKTMEKKEQK